MISKDKFSDQDYNLWILLNHTRHAMFRARELELKRYGVTAEQARLLFTIRALGENATPTEVAKQAFKESHTISSLVNRTEKKNLVKRVKNLENKKSVRIVLTDKGENILNQIMRLESIHQIVSGLSKAKRKQLQSCLEILFRRAVQKIDLEGKSAGLSPSQFISLV